MNYNGGLYFAKIHLMKLYNNLLCILIVPKQLLLYNTIFIHQKKQPRWTDRLKQFTQEKIGVHYPINPNLKALLDKILTDFVNEIELNGAYMHRFSWLKDEEIGSIDHTWNYLVGVYDDKDGSPKALHYTEGGPWFENYRNCEFHTEWKQELQDMIRVKATYFF